jgi:hypothetical protein
MLASQPVEEAAMPAAPVSWSDDVDEVLRGDITAAVAYVTPAGGAVVTAVAPCGIDDRAAGAIGFTTSLGFGKKLERIARNPRVALAYHSRQHGFSTRPPYVLAQGQATVDLTPSEERLEAFAPQAARYLGELKRGLVWDRLLHEYYQERVFVDVAVDRLVAWPDLHASGEPACSGLAVPPPPPPQRPPTKGTGPRVDVAKAAKQLTSLSHRVLAYRGADGYPVVVPVDLAGHDKRGILLVDPGHHLLPTGGRRAGVLAHAYRPQLVGLATRVFTGWLEVADDGTATYAPHTVKGFVAPPRKNLLLVTNGLMAKYGVRQARRSGLAEQLEALAGARVSI